MIWTDMIEEYPKDAHIHPLFEGKGNYDGRKYRPAWHASQSVINSDGKVISNV